MSRPKIIIKRTFIDWVLEFFALGSLLFSIIITIIYWKELPSKIPIHYNIFGQPDSMGPKILLLLLPLIGIISFTGMTIITGYPHVFNYPIEINEQNVHFSYKISVRTILLLKMFVSLIFTQGSCSIIFSAISNINVFNNFIFIFLILAVVIIPLISIIILIKGNKKITTTPA